MLWPFNYPKYGQIGFDMHILWHFNTLLFINNGFIMEILLADIFFKDHLYLSKFVGFFFCLNIQYSSINIHHCAHIVQNNCVI